MAIDPSIASSVQVPRIQFDPVGALNTVADIQTQQFRLQEARRKSMAQMRIRQLAALHPNDPDAFVDALGAEFPEEAAGFSEQLSKARKEGALAQKARLESDKLTLDTALQVLQGSTPENYATRRGLAVKLGGDVADQMLPQQYDPMALESAFQVAQKTSDYLTAQQKATDLFLKGDVQRGVADLFANSQTPEQWQATREYVSQAGKQAKELAGLFGDFSPEAVARAGQMAMSAEQRATGADRAEDNARQAARDAQQQAVENARLGLERQRVGMDAARLGLEKRRVNLAESEAAKPKAAASGKPSTGAERKALSYFNRAKQASDDLEQIEPQIENMGLLEQGRMKYAPNVAQSQLGQSYLQSQRAFTEARLRKDSGAAIPEQEFENDRQTYFVQPGDSKATIAQKRRARQAILSSLAFESGKALGEFYGDEAEGMISGYRSAAAGKAPQAAKADPLGIR